MRRRVVFLFLAFLAAAPCLRAQTDSLLREGDRLHRQYRFEEALEHYLQASALTTSADTVRMIRTRIDNAQNALTMTDFCADPVVIARSRFSRDNFFLFYPLKSGGWRRSPNVLDPADDGFPVYAPRGSQVVYFSAPDQTGARNLYVTRESNRLWSAPVLMGENLLTAGNEVFPIVSDDGKTLTFASNGLRGMGGYDLYTSTWDEETETWGEPVNMGFPYSSPGDDFLLVDSPDGRYTLFASNRDCPRDSICVYVVEKQVSPARVPMRDPVALARTAALDPQNDPSRQDHRSAVAEAAPENDDTRLYGQKVAEMRALQDSIRVRSQLLDTLRTRLSGGGVLDRTALTAAIADGEAALIPLRQRLDKTNGELREIEQSFLRNGVVPVSVRSGREVVGTGSGYTFSKNSLSSLQMKVEPAPAADNPSFRIGPVGRFAQNTTLPEGIVYQIQLFTSARHASLDEINGLDPVYERLLTSSLRYTYSVGLFRTFNDALQNLNPIRALGFPDAEIIAFQNGRPIAVSLARRAE